MSSLSPRHWSALTAAALLVSTLAIPAAAAGPVSVTVNGNPLNLSPAPTERAGRVFVPLRGVFENLGASVVYEGGVINASGRGHTISLKIGSQQATVDGQQQTIDVAPFIIGASTYVPLRFVSQALGAVVNYDGSHNLVAISTNGGNVAQNPPAQTITPAPNPNIPYGAITLGSVTPGRGASVSSRRPAIEATFSGGTADPNSVRIYVDQLDVTGDSTRSPGGFAFAPRSPLLPGSHHVRVQGNDSNGKGFNRGWNFTSGTSTASAGQITSLRPVNGATVPNQFTVTGQTTPGAQVTVQVGSSNSAPTTVGGIIGAILGGGGGGGNSASSTVTADGNGVFRTSFSINAPSGTQMLLVVHATDPNSGVAIAPVQETLTLQ
jgi:hypothetical protein